MSDLLSTDAERALARWSTGHFKSVQSAVDEIKPDGARPLEPDRTAQPGTRFWTFPDDSFLAARGSGRHLQLWTGGGANGDLLQ